MKVCDFCHEDVEATYPTKTGEEICDICRDDPANEGLLIKREYRFCIGNNNDPSQICFGVTAANEEEAIELASHFISSSTIKGLKLGRFDIFDDSGNKVGTVEDVIIYFRENLKATSDSIIEDVEDDEEKCRVCGEGYDPCGDGYDGVCPSCADKAEEKDE